MKLHANARLSVKGRELLVDRVENARRASGWPDLHPPTARTADKERSPSRCREPDVISENPSSADSGHTPNAGGLVRGAVLARSSLGPESTVGVRGRRAAARQRARVERHVGECGDCRRLAAGPKLLVDGLHRLPALEGGGALRVAASVRKRLREPPACDLNRATESAGQTGHE